MAGGMGGSETTKTEIPAWLEDAAKTNMARADKIAGLGYVPYYGADVAALTPDQLAAQANNQSAASAFGLGGAGGGTGLPNAQSFAGGVQGYSSAPAFEQSQQMLKQNAPGIYNLLKGMFVNPITGKPGFMSRPGTGYAPTVQPRMTMAPQQVTGYAPENRPNNR